MAEWKNGGMAEWRNDGMAEWSWHPIILPFCHSSIPPFLDYSTKTSTHSVNHFPVRLTTIELSLPRKSRSAWRSPGSA